MKTLTHRAAAVAATIAVTTATTTAFAAPENAEPTGLVGWAFLGFIALIIVAQVMPAMMMIVGAVLGLRKADHEAKARN
jgi:hypothetical protein